MDEPLLRALQRHPGFTGIRAPASLRMLQLADDKLVGLCSPADYTALTPLLDAYAAASGAKLNGAKSELILLGPSTNHPEEWAAVPAKVVEVSTRYLGVQIGRRVPKEALWGTVRDKFTATLAAWSKRNLTLRGRITVIRTLASSQLWHIAAVTRCPTDVASSLQAAVWRRRRGEAKCAARSASSPAPSEAWR
jgi:hypothetical protein